MPQGGSIKRRCSAEAYAGVGHSAWREFGRVAGQRQREEKTMMCARLRPVGWCERKVTVERAGVWDG